MLILGTEGPMAKARSTTQDYAVYLLVRILVCVFQCLSLEAGRVFGRFLAWLAFRLDRRHREVARDNLFRAFPGQYDEQQIQALIRATYGHFGHLLIEIIHLPRKLRPNNWRRYIDVLGGPELVECLLMHRPVLIVTGHYGNWEMAGYALAMLGFKTFAVARSLDNPYLDRFLRKFRQRTGQKLLAKKGELDRIEDILKRGGIVCTVADQDAGPRGLYVDFFGRPASTHKAIALLAMEHDATMIVAGARRIGDPMRYQLEATDIIRPNEFERQTGAARALTQRFTAGLERLVRQDIRQYFWLHRRWKHQPAKKTRSVA
jgi:KDO2-lipid IV(A) lauroyltransferase